MKKFQVKFYIVGGCLGIPKFSHDEYYQANSEDELITYVVDNLKDVYDNPYFKPKGEGIQFDIMSENGGIIINELEFKNI